MSDYISREELLKEKWTLENPDGSSEEVVSALDIKMIPSADVRENIHGKWIDFPDDRVQCSECNMRYPRFHRANFCDNCGADMREFLKNEGHRYDILKGESWG